MIDFKKNKLKEYRKKYSNIIQLSSGIEGGQVSISNIHFIDKKIEKSLSKIIDEAIEEGKKSILKHLPDDYEINFIADCLNQNLENNCVGEDHYSHLDFIARLITMLKLAKRNKIAEELTKKHEDEAGYLMAGENYKPSSKKE